MGAVCASYARTDWYGKFNMENSSGFQTWLVWLDDCNVRNIQLGSGGQLNIPADKHMTINGQLCGDGHVEVRGALTLSEKAQVCGAEIRIKNTSGQSASLLDKSMDSNWIVYKSE